MTWLKRLTITLTIALLPGLAQAALSGYGRISVIRGDVQIRMEDSDEWLPAAINTPVEEGDSIWSPDGSRVEIQLRNGACLRLDGRSALDILRLDDKYQQLYLGTGRLYVRTGARQETGIQVDFDDTTVRVYDRTRLRIDLSERGDQDISILKGYANVESGDDRTRVRAGEMLSVDGRGMEISPLPPPDEWERWNRERDRKVAKKAKRNNYLPEELAVYEEELDSTGEWVLVPEYGYLWRPTVILGEGWAPYRTGRWVWRGGDYVWISQESWGWAPYHYGRWVITPRYGWCWVPPARSDAFWGPGYVGWVTTPSHIGWVPLAPGEIYYGYGNFGRFSVNISSANINTSRPSRIVYRNVTVNNAVTVVNRTSFNAGRMVTVTPRENIFAEQRGVFARPVPQVIGRETRMPAIRSIPRQKLPPPAVGRIRPKELRARHPRSGDDRPTPPLPAEQPRRGASPAPVIATQPTRSPQEQQPAQTRQPRQIRRQQPVLTPETGPSLQQQPVKEQRPAPTRRQQPAQTEQQAPARQTSSPPAVEERQPKAEPESSPAPRQRGEVKEQNGQERRRGDAKREKSQKETKERKVWKVREKSDSEKDNEPRRRGERE